MPRYLVVDYSHEPGESTVHEVVAGSASDAALALFPKGTRPLMRPLNANMETPRLLHSEGRVTGKNAWEVSISSWKLVVIEL